MPYRSSSDPRRLVCARCGSPRVIPGVPLVDRYGAFGREQRPFAVEIEGDPIGWLQTDRASGGLRARICGDCGHTELWIDNHRELYAKYEAALAKRPPEARERPLPARRGDCLECGAAIPEDEDRCRACGWSWAPAGDPEG